METLTKLDEELRSFTSSEFSQFQSTCRKLLKETFVVRDKNEEHRKVYVFIARHLAAFNEYFRLMGYAVMCDHETGVAMLTNHTSEEDSIQSNRRMFKLSESIVLSALWLMYDEAMMNRDKFTKSIEVKRLDLETQLEKSGLDKRIDKRAMGSILKVLESHNLIEVSYEVADPRCKIRLLASLQFCLDENAFRDYAKATAEKMRERTRRGASGAGYAGDGTEGTADDIDEYDDIPGEDGEVND